MLTRTRRFERPDYWILAAVGILCIIGVLMVFSSSGIDPETSNLIDLMAALEASVDAAKKARTASGSEPVSVADAKAAKAAGAKARSKTAAASARAEAEAKDDEDTEAEAPAKTVRKRKTA